MTCSAGTLPFACMRMHGDLAWCSDWSLLLSLHTTQQIASHVICIVLACKAMHLFIIKFGAGIP